MINDRMDGVMLSDFIHCYCFCSDSEAMSIYSVCVCIYAFNNKVDQRASTAGQIHTQSEKGRDRKVLNHLMQQRNNEQVHSIYT